MSSTVRSLQEFDHDRWRELFAQYQSFYRAKVPDETVLNTWQRIHDSSSSVSGLGAEVDGVLVGFTHFLYHESTWSERLTCYLEDLFVENSARGTDTAKKLILGVEAAARKEDAFRVYWHTQQYNSKARSLYDSITPPSSFIVYRMSI